MKKSSISLAVLSALTLAAGLVTPAVAEDFKMPEKKPVISVTLPGSWKPEETDAGVQGQSPDGAVYLAIESSRSEKGVSEIIDSTFDMFKEHKVDVDKSTKKTNKLTIAGEDAEEMLYSGKDEDGPATISLTIFSVKDTVIVITYWASSDKVEKDNPTIGKIVKSIKAL